MTEISSADDVQPDQCRKLFLDELASRTKHLIARCGPDHKQSKIEAKNMYFSTEITYIILYTNNVVNVVIELGIF